MQDQVFESCLKEHAELPFQSGSIQNSLPPNRKMVDPGLIQTKAGRAMRIA